MIFRMNVSVDTGVDSVRRNAGKLSSFGSHALIVSGAGSARKSGALDDVCEALSSKSLALSLFDRVAPNPTVASCIDAARFGREQGADFVIGIGGGSALDTAKAAAVFLTNPELDEDGFYQSGWKNRPAPVVLVGTTSGTGSEVTSVSVLIDKTGRKHSLHHDDLFASLALGDPRYTMSLPSGITLSTGIDALTHCIESYFSHKANDVSRPLSVQGIRMMIPLLEKAANGVSLTLEDRAGLYDGSVIAGLAICVTGTVFPHSIGYYLTEQYQVPHGIACATYTADLLRHVRKTLPAYADGFYREIGISENRFLELWERIRPRAGVTLQASELDPILSRWNNNSVRNTISDISLEEIREIMLK